MNKRRRNSPCEDSCSVGASPAQCLFACGKLSLCSQCPAGHGASLTLGYGCSNGVNAPAKGRLMALGWLPYFYAVCVIALLVFTLSEAKADWQAWELYKSLPAYSMHPGPGILAWKQAVVPVQFEQASCGACHRDDLPQTPRLNHGRLLLVTYNCVACHKLQGIERPAMLGPDLTNVGNKVSREWIYKWLKNPRTIYDDNGNVVVDGVDTSTRMPQFHLSDPELRALSAYLSVQRANPVEHYSFHRSALASFAKKGDAADQGETRFNQMFCITCHALSVTRGGQSQLIGGNIGPELTKVGSKVKPEWLVAWLRNPQGYLLHTKMPRFQWSDEDLYAVTQYILRQLNDPDLLKDVPQMGAPTADEVQLGKQLFVRKGCAECHVIRGVEPRKNFGPDLSAEGIAAGLYPVTGDSKNAHFVPVHFDSGKVSKLQVSESIVPRFMISFIQAKLSDPTSVTPQANMPKFNMSQADLDDVTTALLSMVGSSAEYTSQKVIVQAPRPAFHPDGQFASIYDRYKCFVCHRFNGYGGTLAPDLSYEGSRSQNEWLIQFLMRPQTIRPTLTSRMPEFNMSEQDARTIADYLKTSMRNPKVDDASAKAFTPEMAARGKQLYEDKFQCQSCHTIGSSGGYVGPSLTNAGNWLTSAWIEAWLSNPQALIPHTIEPHQSFGRNEIDDLTAYLLTLKQSPQSAMASGGNQ